MNKDEMIHILTQHGIDALYDAMNDIIEEQYKEGYSDGWDECYDTYVYED